MKIIKCRKRLIDKSDEECTENINEKKMTNATLNEDKNVCRSCKIYTVLFVIAFLIIIGISSAFTYLC